MRDMRDMRDKMEGGGKAHRCSHEIKGSPPARQCGQTPRQSPERRCTLNFQPTRLIAAGFQLQELSLHSAFHSVSTCCGKGGLALLEDVILVGCALCVICPSAFFLRAVWLRTQPLPAVSSLAPSQQPLGQPPTLLWLAQALG